MSRSTTLSVFSLLVMALALFSDLANASSGTAEGEAEGENKEGGAAVVASVSLLTSVLGSLFAKHILH